MMSSLGVSSFSSIDFGIYESGYFGLMLLFLTHLAYFNPSPNFSWCQRLGSSGLLLSTAGGAKILT